MIKGLYIRVLVPCALGLVVTMSHASGPEPEPRLGDPATQAGQRARQAAKVGRRHLPSPLLIPDQTIPLRFSHKVHLAEGATCNDCHGMTQESVRSSDVNLPVEETCFDCHDVEDIEADPPAACATCHPGYVAEFPKGVALSETHKALVHPPTVTLPAPRIKFTHKLHLTKGISCETCHGDLSAVDFATRDNALPLMETCMDCHDGAKAPDACGTCHETLPNGRLRTEFPEGLLRPAGWYFGDAHDDDWLMNHRVAAQTNEGYCSNCHAPKECVDCHNGVRKPLKIHPNDWVSQHATAARRNAPDCQSCHRSQTFCVTCHEALKVGGDPGHRPTKFTLHPPGWVELPRGPNHHGYQAKRNIRACTSCHTERTCLTCHASSELNGAGYNPHPPGFVISGDCRRMKAKNGRSCVKCHTSTSDRLQCR